MSDSSSDEYMSTRSYPSSYSSGGRIPSSLDTYSRDDDVFSVRSGTSRSSGQHFGGTPSSRPPSIEYDIPRDYYFTGNFPTNGPHQSRPAAAFPSFFNEPQHVQPFPPPRMDLDRVQRNPHTIDWVSKLNLWDQAQKTRTESKYEYRQLDNGDHIAQVNVAGSGRIFQGIAKKKMQAKQEAAMGACEALRLRVG